MARQSIEEEQIESEVHTVPLKVLGSCHSGERQKILEVFEYLNEYNASLCAVGKRTRQFT